MLIIVLCFIYTFFHAKRNYFGILLLKIRRNIFSNLRISTSSSSSTLVECRFFSSGTIIIIMKVDYVVGK